MTATWDPEDMAKAAFHEAGHAIVAWSLCLTVDHVELDVANNSGHAGIAAAEDAAHRVAVSYAGFEAEDMFKGPAAFARAKDDFKRAEHELTNYLRGQVGKGLYSPEGRRLQVDCRACARDWLSMHKAKVERVAEELLKPPHKICKSRFAQLVQEA
jgi:ATP-dependent Zn protease